MFSYENPSQGLPLLSFPSRIYPKTQFFMKNFYETPPIQSGLWKPPFQPGLNRDFSMKNPCLEMAK